MEKRVAFIDSVHPILNERLVQAGYQCLDYTKKSKKEVFESLFNIEGIVIRSRIKVDKTFIDAAPQLQFIARSGAGMENIDLKYAAEKNIICHHAAEGNQQAVAEHALGMLLSLLNHLKRGDNEVRNGIWQREANRGKELNSLTVGIIGYGYMGSAFAQVLSGIGCKIMAYDKYKSGFGNNLVIEVSLKELQQNADVISLHLPLTQETENYINNSFINECAKSIYLLNTSRGNQLVIKDLVDGLNSEKILGAGLDVFEYEKTSFEKWGNNSSPEWDILKTFENVIMSPHVAGWTKESYFKLSNVLADKILG